MSSDNSTKKQEYTITKKDIDYLMERAKYHFERLPMPMKISESHIDHRIFVNISMIEATIDYLSKNKLLTEIPKIDYTKK